MRGALYVLAAAVMWGLIGPVSKLAFLEGMAPLDVAFWRTAMAWVLYAAHAAAIRAVVIERRDAPLIALFGVFGVAGLFGSYVYAVQAGGAALASVLLYTAPAWVALMSRVVLGERLTPARLAAVAATMVGVAGVSLGGGGDGKPVTAPAVLWGLTAGVTYALYYIFGKHYLSRYRTPTLFLYALPVGAMTLLPFLTLSLPTTGGLLACACLALLSTYGAYSVYYAGLRRMEATRAAVLATIEPVVAAGLAYLWYDERFGLFGYLGGLCIIGSVLLTIFGDSGSKRPPRPSPQASPSRPD